MGAGGGSPIAPKLRREDYNRTRHDPVFSRWQVLIGPNDWEDHSNGKEGVARYRVHNLPNRSCPGLYELGVTVARLGLGDDTDGFYSDVVIVTYLGQADSVRSRLQRYGRSGAHLGNNETCDLFEQIFSRGCSIVYRWAPMETKRDAEKTEAKLLKIFDYAWNSGKNGFRRQDDVLGKIDNMTSNTRRLPSIMWMLRAFTDKQVGIRIKVDKVVLEDAKDSTGTINQGDNFFSAIFKTSRSRPKLVLDKSEVKFVQGRPVCGVTLKDGTSCARLPVQGRKRCKEHKGKKLYGFDVKSTAKGDAAHSPATCSDSNSYPSQESHASCGVILKNGETCERRPVAGRKRCEEHKGMTVKVLIGTSAETKPTDNTDHCERTTNKGIASTTLDGGKSLQQRTPDIHAKDSPILCGARLRNGSFCRRKPGKESGKCWQHRETTLGRVPDCGKGESCVK